MEGLDDLAIDNRTTSWGRYDWGDSQRGAAPPRAMHASKRCFPSAPTNTRKDSPLPDSSTHGAQIQPLPLFRTYAVFDRYSRPAKTRTHRWLGPRCANPSDRSTNRSWLVGTVLSPKSGKPRASVAARVSALQPPAPSFSYGVRHFPPVSARHRPDSAGPITTLRSEVPLLEFPPEFAQRDARDRSQSFALGVATSQFRAQPVPPRKSQIAVLKSQISNFKSQVSELKPETGDVAAPARRSLNTRADIGFASPIEASWTVA